MISHEYIMEALKRWASTKKGKAAIKEKYGIDYDDKRNESLKKYAEKMKEILYNHVHSVIKSIEMDDIEIGDFKVNKSGQLTVKISFREGSLHRESLRPDLYPDGLDNIVLLFAHGYETKNPIYGVWNNSRSYPAIIEGKRSRAANNYLNEAVAEFNAYGGKIAQAVLESEYR